MSSKSTIVLTADNEHIYSDCNEYLKTKDGGFKHAITVEIDLANARVECCDDYDLVFTLTNPDSEIYALFEGIGKAKKLQQALDLAADQNKAMKIAAAELVGKIFEKPDEITEQEINEAANMYRVNSDYKGSAFDFTAGAEWAIKKISGKI